ncbi:MAG: hypothetical protein M5R40_15400 [Anaerolineae bacterium]|nr:hypothetical protein [Anaerolineae bacterium]
MTLYAFASGASKSGRAPRWTLCTCNVANSSAASARLGSSVPGRLRRTAITSSSVRPSTYSSSSTPRHTPSGMSARMLSADSPLSPAWRV